MKTTKNITATYNTHTKVWTVRDNYQIVAQGEGVLSWTKKLIELEQTAQKPVKVSSGH